jgi:hypothetical protein
MVFFMALENKKLILLASIIIIIAVVAIAGFSMIGNQATGPAIMTGQAITGQAILPGSYGSIFSVLFCLAKCQFELDACYQSAEDSFQACCQQNEGLNCFAYQNPNNEFNYLMESCLNTILEPIQHNCFNAYWQCRKACLVVPSLPGLLIK